MARPRVNGCGTCRSRPAPPVGGVLSLFTILGSRHASARPRLHAHGRGQALPGARGNGALARGAASLAGRVQRSGASRSRSPSETTIWLPWALIHGRRLPWPWALFLVERLDDAPSRRSVRASGTAGRPSSRVWGLAGHPGGAAVGALFSPGLARCSAWPRARSNPRAVTLGGGTAAASPWARPLSSSCRGSRRSAPEPEGERGALRVRNRVIKVGVPRAALAGRIRHALHSPRLRGRDRPAPMIPPPGYSFPRWRPAIRARFRGCCSFWFSAPEARAAATTGARGDRRVRNRRGDVVLARLVGGTGAACPGSGVMLPLRFLGWIPIAVGALAAFELDRLRTDACRRRRPAARPSGSPPPPRFCRQRAAVFRHFRPAYVAAGGYPGREEGPQPSRAVVLLAAGLAASSPRAPRLSAGLRGPFSSAKLSWAPPRPRCSSSAPTARPPGAGPLVIPGHSRSSASCDLTRRGVFRPAEPVRRSFRNANVFASVEDVRTHDPDGMRGEDYAAFLGR